MRIGKAHLKACPPGYRFHFAWIPTRAKSGRWVWMEWMLKKESKSK